MEYTKVGTIIEVNEESCLVKAEDDNIIYEARYYYPRQCFIGNIVVIQHVNMVFNETVLSFWDII